MDWNGNQLRAPAAFVSRPETSFSFLYNYDHHYPAGTEMKHPQTQHGVAMMDKNNFEKKKRLTSEQLESLEMSFQEEIKLDPDRKMNIAQELGLQPRQVAVWFQNKRARWKAKQLERLYDSLKRELDRVSREKHQLQEEVIALRAIILKEEAAKKHVSAGYTDISGEDTVESTSLVPIQSCNYMPQGTPVATTSNNQNQHQNIGDDNECNYVFNMDDYNPVGMIPYWDSVMPCYP